MRASLIVPALAVAVCICAEISAQELRCAAPFGTLLSDEMFARNHMAVPTRALKSHAPDVRYGRAHLYRSVIREGARGSPDFAGHYKIIRIGCGAATICVAIADALNGKVYFPPVLRSASALLVDTAGIDVDTLNYRPNSILLIVVGLPNEELSKAGIHYYAWRSNRLRLVGFTSAVKLCALPPSTRF